MIYGYNKRYPTGNKRGIAYTGKGNRRLEKAVGNASRKSKEIRGEPLE